jgi:hypothetical protein
MKVISPVLWTPRCPNSGRYTGNTHARDTSGDSYSSLDDKFILEINHHIIRWQPFYTYGLNLSSNGFYTLTRTTLDSTEMAYYLRLDINHEEGFSLLFLIPIQIPIKTSRHVHASPHVTGIVALILQNTGTDRHGLEKKSLRTPHPKRYSFTPRRTWWMQSGTPSKGTQTLRTQKRTIKLTM